MSWVVKKLQKCILYSSSAEKILINEPEVWISAEGLFLLVVSYVHPDTVQEWVVISLGTLAVVLLTVSPYLAQAVIKFAILLPLIPGC